ncbi:MAG TPA: DegQ family serine endoprotease [Rhodocyclaceae bacterium]
MKRIQRLTVGLAAVTLFSAGYAMHDSLSWPGAHASTNVPAVQADASRPAASMRLPDFTSIVADQGPAVVNIRISGTRKTALGGLPGIDDDSPLGDFFRHFGVPMPRGGESRVPVRGEGSGFIVSPDGIVLTNAHVVADADEVIVRLTDKREFKAKVIGQDKPTDVAVLRIAAKNLPTVHIGSAQHTRVGEWVVAIGSPFGFENSVTAGIISAKARSLPDEGYVPFMQTDVAINPGNSGGPLFNAAGEVIGINSQIYSESGGYQGLSFAIPIDVAMNVEQQLLAHGKVSRGKLGVTVQELDQALADSFGLDKPRGALVSSVEPGSPAARAGIEPGDVILKFNGNDISRASDLPALVAAAAPGTEVSLETWRKGKTRTLSLATGELKAAKTADAQGASPATGKLGLAVRPLSPEEKRELGAGGLAVEAVDGPAARAGIRPGDVILAVNGEPVSGVDQLRHKVGDASGAVALLVQRGGHRLFVPIKAG